MTCKDCIHYDVCGGFIPSDLDRDVFDYCKKGKTEEIPDIDERCNSFKNKADFAEVKHGEWIKEHLIGCEPCYFCSLCGKLHDQDYNYCHNCGAKNGIVRVIKS